MTDLWHYVPNFWRSELEPVHKAFDQISELLLLQGESGHLINPKSDLILRVLETPPDAVQVLIVGQDPYPKHNYAIGRAFAVPNDVQVLPPSLRNIFKELADDIEPKSSTNPDLQNWVDQGVMLLNRSLTTNDGESNSHTTFGWEAITRKIAQIAVSKNPDLVAMLWGANAQELAKEFQPNRIIQSAHPSPLSAHRGFLGSKPFSRANQLLVAGGGKPIAW